MSEEEDFMESCTLCQYKVPTEDLFFITLIYGGDEMALGDVYEHKVCQECKDGLSLKLQPLMVKEQP